MENIKQIGYQDCADAMLKMWMENILTDGEYGKIMEKLNKAYMDGIVGQKNSENCRGKRSLVVGRVVDGGIIWKNIKTGEETFEQYN